PAVLVLAGPQPRRPRTIQPPAGVTLPRRTPGRSRFSALPGSGRVPGVAVADRRRHVRGAGRGPPQRWTESAAPVHRLEPGRGGGLGGGGRCRGPGAGLRVPSKDACRPVGVSSRCERGQTAVIGAGRAEAAFRLIHPTNFISSFKNSPPSGPFVLRD